MLYRELLRRGISDYLISPVGVLDVVRSICGLFSAPDAKPVGRIIAVIGAKGGVGASTIAHNVAWAIARDLRLDTVISDLDLGFGTAGLDFNQDPPQGIADAVFSPDRIDTAFVDRLLSKCTEQLSLLAAPATLDRVYDFSSEAFDSICDSLRTTVPCTVLDVPHQWTGWTKRTLVEGGRSPIPAAGLGAPLVSAPAPSRRAPGAAGASSPPLAPTATDSRHTESYYETKSMVFGALIEAIDLAQLAKLDADSSRKEIRDIVNEIIAIKAIVLSISEQEELLDDICNDVLGHGPLEPLLARDDIADTMRTAASVRL